MPITIDEPEVKRMYIGTRFADKVEKGAQNLMIGAANKVQELSKDQEGIHDDALRLIGGGIKNLRNWSKDQEGVGDDILRLAGGGVGNALKIAGFAGEAGGWAGGKIAGALGVDPRIGRTIGGVAGDMILPGAVASKLKIASKLKNFQNVRQIKGINRAINSQGKYYSGLPIPGLDDAGKAVTKAQYKAKAYNLHVTEGLDMKSVKKQMGGFWIDPKDGTQWAVHTDKGKGVKMIGRKARGTRDIKRKQMTLDQSTGVGEDTFVKYDSKGNISDLLVKEGDEIHHWNSLIDKSSAYVDLSRKEAQELTTMVREAGWFFGDNKGNLLKMVREDHKKIHAWMRENGIEGVRAQKLMEKHYKGKSVKQRFGILKGFMEYVQGGVDEELIKMGYKIPSSHKAAQKANRAVQQQFIKGK